MTAPTRPLFPANDAQPKTCRDNSLARACGVKTVPPGPCAQGGYAMPALQEVDRG